MLFLGIAFLAMGVAGEALRGTWFEDFLDPRYPRGAGPPWWRDSYVVNVRGGRLFIWLGLGMTILGAVEELA